MRRVRASFLLRLVVLLGGAALVVAVVLLGASTGWTTTAGVLAAALWLLGVEGGLLVVPLVWLARRGTAVRGGPIRSVWFVDVEAEREGALARFHDATRDNPTIR